VIRTCNSARKGDALVRRQVAQWRRATARLQVLMNSGGGAALASEAHGLSRQCERLAADLARVAGRRAGGDGDGGGSGD